MIMDDIARFATIVGVLMGCLIITVLLIIFYKIMIEKIQYDDNEDDYEEEESVEELKQKLERLEKYLHSKKYHPDYEYLTLTTIRKGPEPEPPSDRWKRNIEESDNGFERFEYHDEYYWRRNKNENLS
jgi:hypothetical protein